MTTPTQASVIATVRRLQAERNHLRSLLRRVAGSVMDKAPDGTTVAYLPPDLADEILEQT